MTKTCWSVINVWPVWGQSFGHMLVLQFLTILGTLYPYPDLKIPWKRLEHLELHGEVLEFYFGLMGRTLLMRKKDCPCDDDQCWFCFGWLRKKLWQPNETLWKPQDKMSSIYNFLLDKYHYFLDIVWCLAVISTSDQCTFKGGGRG